jgi:hypothetical protein
MAVDIYKLSEEVQSSVDKVLAQSTDISQKKEFEIKLGQCCQAQEYEVAKWDIISKVITSLARLVIPSIIVSLLWPNSSYETYILKLEEALKNPVVYALIFSAIFIRDGLSLWMLFKQKAILSMLKSIKYS